jgi:hypothetical protein
MDANSRGLAAIAAAAEPDGSRESGTATVRIGAGTLKIGLSQEEHAAALLEAKAEGKKEGNVAAATGERARIAAIVNAPEAKGRESLANHLAFSTELAPAAAIEMLKAAPVAAPEKTSRLDGKVPAPKVDAVESGAQRDRAAGLSAAVAHQLEKIGKKPKLAAAGR